MARNAYTYEKFMREKKKAEKKKEREAKKAARLAAKKDGDESPETDGSAPDEGERAGTDDERVDG